MQNRDQYRQDVLEAITDVVNAMPTLSPLQRKMLVRRIQIGIQNVNRRYDQEQREMLAEQMARSARIRLKIESGLSRLRERRPQGL